MKNGTVNDPTPWRKGGELLNFEMVAVLVCNVAYIRGYLPTLRHNISIPSSGIKQSKTTQPALDLERNGTRGKTERIDMNKKELKTKT